MQKRYFINNETSNHILYLNKIAKPCSSLLVELKRFEDIEEYECTEYIVYILKIRNDKQILLLFIKIILISKLVMQKNTNSLNFLITYTVVSLIYGLYE